MTVNTSKCATCSHPQRRQIDLALVAGIACRSVARQYGLSPDSVQRHRNSHLPAGLLRDREAEEIACARVLVEQVGALHKRTLATLTEAERTGQLRTVMTAIREARRNLELLVRVQVRSQPGPVQDLASSPEWLAVRAGILRALEPYPEARYAVSEEMLRLVGEQVGDGTGERAGAGAAATGGQEKPDADSA